MYSKSELLKKLESPEYAAKFSHIYCTDESSCKEHIKRFTYLINNFTDFFNSAENIRLFSAPGRTEVGGNHTDHQRGKVLAASVNLDTIAAVALNGSNKINVKSEGYDLITIDINDLEIKEEQFNTTASLIRGITAAFIKLGYKIEGFNAFITSNVLKGSGLSSSAAFEVLIGTIINNIFCNGKETNIKIAQIGQYAENVYFGKPSGLMDQMASSVGGFVTIDFKDAENPIVEKIDFDFSSCGYSLCIADAVGDHADLTDEYALVTYEMKSVSEFFGKSVLSEVSKEDFYKNIAEIRLKCGDRAVLRSMHYYNDNERVVNEVTALKNNDFESFKKNVIESGHSSYMYLQNVFSSKSPESQCLSIALAIAEKILKDKGGAYRVHGGGFAGTIQAFVPNEIFEQFRTEIENIFGKGTCHRLSIRPVGGIEI